MIPDTISRATARLLYNALGTALDHADRYEAEAKARALSLLPLATAQRLLHVGVGTGREHTQLARAIAPQGSVVGLDLARGMLTLTRQQVNTPLVEGDATHLPFVSASFDALFSGYMLDLLPTADIPIALREFRRVVRPGSTMVLLSLTEGTTFASRLFVALWKARFYVNPNGLGGCRPIQLTDMVESAGFTLQHRELVIQRGFPSEIVVATA